MILITSPVQFAVGVALALAGWVLYWAGLHVAGGLLGAAIGGAGVWLAAVLAGLEARLLLAAAGVGALLGFVLGSLFMRRLHRFFFFALGAALGLLLANRGLEAGGRALSDFFGRCGWAWNPTAARIAASIFGPLLGGVLLAAGSKWVVAALTALVGAALMTFALSDPIALLAAPPVALFAFLIQAGCLRRAFRPRAAAPADP